jgi:glycosyltransferase involved in cell wall biosynthesis
MDILFIHKNFPAQFRVLSQVLASDPAHRVVFLTNRDDPEAYPVPGVEPHRFELHRAVNPATHHYLHSMEEGVLTGQAVLREALRLRESGFLPRLIIFHAGTGVGLYVSQAFPEAKTVGYFEWYFRSENNRDLLGSDDVETACRALSSNFLLFQDLEACDAAVVPTSWQHAQFPLAYQDKLRVIFDGLDTEFFSPALVGDDLVFRHVESDRAMLVRPHDLLMTYATRGMETLRGFPEFMRMLPPLLAKYPSLHVVIAGQDRQAYSYPAPTHDGSWKRLMLDELGDFPGRERLCFAGSLDYARYRDLLRRSDLHCYFSRPYITSWSLFEAVACGARLMVNSGPHTSGLLPQAVARWVDLDDQQGLLSSAQAQLQAAPQLQGQPRQSLLPESFGLVSSLSRWQSLLRELLGQV